MVSPIPEADGHKIVVAGAFAVGKTTFVSTISEVIPLRTEADLTTASSSTDDLAGVESKTTTTVSLDFGRITFPGPKPWRLYLFGTPGQERFRFMWKELCFGAVGAVVLADTRRLEDSFDPIAFFERHQLPFVVAVNEFDNTPYHYEADEVRDALALEDDKVPVLLCDARQVESVRDVLISLVQHALERAQSRHISEPAHDF